MLEAFLSSLFVAILSEVADKTQLVILGLALKFRSPWRVFGGALLAHAAMDGLAVAVGGFAGNWVPWPWLRWVVGGLFVALGVWELLKREEGHHVVPHRGAFVSSFLAVFVSEFGDKSQLAAGLLAAAYQVPVAVFVGFVLGLALTIGLNVLVSGKIAKCVSERNMRLAIGVVFIVFGLLTMFR
ncbi:TMEM165/GDT1 family protein [Candidatus Woesearchaeota archaeon]|nr:TMEM165/GDT1 family protein [Candidatus Woesearchaeota archaeon]